MGRKSGFTDEDVFVWLADHLATAPGVTVQQVSKGTKVSVGSIYHRFGSMEDLLAEAWVWAHERYRVFMTKTLQMDGEAGALRSAVKSVRFATLDRPAAILLFAVPKRFLVRSGISATNRAKVNFENQTLADEINGYATRFGTDADSIDLAVIQVPKAIIQKYLPDEPVPAQAEVYVRKSCKVILNNPIHATDDMDA